MKHNNESSVTVERMRILYETVIRQNVVTFIATLIIAYIYREQFSPELLMTWSSFMFVGIGLRFWCLHYYKKHAASTPDHGKFETYFAYANAYVGLGWAIYIVLSLSLPSFTYRIYSILLLAAMVGAAVPVLMSSIKVLFAYIAPAILVSIPLLFMLGGEDSATGVAVLVYSLVIVKSGKYTYYTLVNSISERIHNQNLVKELEHTRHAKSESEKRMQSIMDYSPAAIYVRDLEGKYTFINQKVSDLRNMQREEILGKTLYDIMPEDVANQIRKNDIEVINAEKPMEYEESIPMFDGVHHFISIKFPLFDKNKRICAVGGVSTDISERFRIEENLRFSQQRLLLHREQSPLGVIEWNTDFEIMDWNPAAEKIFGYTQEEVRGQHITQNILPDPESQGVAKVWESLLANKGSTISVNENLTKDGRTILCEWHGSPLVNEEGEVIGVISLVDDITERQKNEENLRHSQKMDAIGKLTGGIAHDFNNMLCVILGFAEQIKEGVTDGEQNILRYNEEIINAGERARKLTSKLLEFSRKAPSSAELTYINKLIHSMQHMLEKTLTPRIELELDLQEDLWPVWIDPTRLEDAVLNLCINSMHAMPDGGKLSLKTYEMQLNDSDTQNIDVESGDYVLLSVSDTGIGMSHDIQQKIFDPFFTTKGTEGTGLGLSQVYGFVQQAGGSIQVFSELGHGTRIAIYFPRYLLTETDKQKNINVDVDKSVSGKEIILVVDDEEVLLELTERILTKQGYTVLRAESAESALEILKANKVDLMVSDVIMPGMDGYELATEVEKLYPDIKIQMVSGFSGDRNNNLSNNALHEQQLSKPYSSQQLLSRVRQLLDE